MFVYYFISRSMRFLEQNGKGTLSKYLADHKEFEVSKQGTLKVMMHYNYKSKSFITHPSYEITS